MPRRRLGVAYRLRGHLTPLSPSLDLSVYRIVQEALTNVTKHAGTAQAAVDITFDDEAVIISVTDKGALHRNGHVLLPDQGDGTKAHHGIIGMRERAAMFGGSLTRRATSRGWVRSAGPSSVRRCDIMTIGVVVVDDQALVRAGFRVLVDSEVGFSVLGEASNGVEAVDLVDATRPDVVLMDVRMPEMDGIEATRRILGAGHGDVPRILILTTFDLDEYVYAALRAGASGFMLKDTPPAELLTAIRVVAAGDALLAPSVTRRLIADFASREAKPTVSAEILDSLTGREREVFGLVAKGMSNQELADALHMSSATAKTHVSRVLMKLEARDRAQLVVIAYETGFITRA